MEDNTKQNKVSDNKAPEVAKAAGAAPDKKFGGSSRPFSPGGAGQNFGPRKPFSRGPGGGRGFTRRDAGRAMNKPELDSKILTIRRVTRVVAGGKRFNFSVYMVVGDKKGSVGVGTVKAGDTAQAIEKAMKNAKSHMFKVKTTPEMSIPCGSDAKYCSASVVLRPTYGKGLIAGSACRDVFVLGGLKDINAKILTRSKNKINIARATVGALKKIEYLCNYTK
ncbi:MAG: 30S ribosomal protein S5 [Candidatus Paceibacterota bacterium]|jgi:small subunit ribosomal protein S5